MKKVIITIIPAIGIAIWSASSLRAAENVLGRNIDLIDWLFLSFCALIVVFMVVKAIQAVIMHFPRRHKKDMLQKHFGKWLES